MKNLWDKIILLLISVVVIGLSGWFMTKALAFKNQFSVPKAKPLNEQPVTDTGQTEAAIKLVKVPTKWRLPLKGSPPKPLPLFVSIPIVEAGGKLIDMTNPKAVKLRSPVENSWLIDNDLDFLNKNVLSQDPDGDGYINIEEWHGKTSPRDSASHPPYADKLVMHSRQAQIYKLIFATQLDGTNFQIKRLQTGKWGKTNFFLSVGNTSKDRQIRLDRFEKQMKRNKLGILDDSSILHITYLPKGTKHQLVRKIPTSIPTYFTELEFSLNPGNKFFVKEGDTFPIARDPNTKYRVTKITEDTTTVTFETAPGQTAMVEIKKK